MGIEVTAEQRLEIRKHHREMQTKFVYFLLAINAAAIGYSVTIPKEENIHWTYLLLTLSIILWGVSFFFGTLYLMFMIAHEGTNQNLLDINIPDMQKEKSKKDMETFNVWAKRFMWYMLYAILGGFITFIIWHITGIPFCEIF